MDQQAFRQLLSTPRPGFSASGSGSGDGMPRSFGVAPKRKADVLSGGFTPRKIAKSGSSSGGNGTSSTEAAIAAKRAAAQERRQTNSLTGERYVDRAEARRRGLEDEEYADVERLRVEFERRAEEAGAERGVVEEQMKLLGGDARHSVLVKGLDHALLRQNRARETLDGEDADEVLEEAFEAAGKGEPVSEPEQTRESLAKRESILEALAKRRLNRNKGTPVAQEEGPTKVESKFRPIGFKAVGDAAPERIVKDGKKLRKKKKPGEVGENHHVVADGEAKPTKKAARPTGPQTKRLKKASRDESQGDDQDKAVAPPTERPSRPATSSTALPASTSDLETAIPAPAAIMPTSDEKDPTEANIALNTTAHGEEAEDEVDDIFSDAGEWDGLGAVETDSDDADEGVTADASTSLHDEQAHTPVSTATPTAPIVRRDWFGARPGEALVDSTSREPGALEGSLGSVLSAVAASASQEASVGGGKEDEVEPASTGRLQGLSSSALPSDVSRAWLAEEDTKGGEGGKKKGKRRRRKGGKGKDDGSDED